MLSKVQEYKGRQNFSIWNDEEDIYPIISFGAPKAASILMFIPELLAYCSEHGGDAGKRAVDKFLRQYAPANGASPPKPESPKKNGGKKEKAEKAPSA